MQDAQKQSPWEIVLPHDAEAAKMFRQDLATLAYRGGLCPVELHCLMTKKPLPLLHDKEYRAAVRDAAHFLNGILVERQNQHAANNEIHPDWVEA